MRKITTFLLINCCCLTILLGQIETIGSNEYGRIFGVTYDKTTENQLYAITTGNHILSSKDNGQTWDIFYGIKEGFFHKFDNNLKTYGDDKLTYALMGPADINLTVYMLDIPSKTIVREYTTPIPDPSAEKYWVNSYNIYKSDADYAMIAIGYRIGLLSYEKVFYTKDGGNTWDMIYYTLENMNIFTGQAAFHPENPEKLYLTRGNGDTDIDGGLLISEDGGQNWVEKIHDIVLQPITFNPTNPNEIWVGTGISFGSNPENLYKSTDGGNTWNIVPIPWSEYILDCINVIEFNPLNPSNIIILEENEVAISHDGGATWTLRVYPDAHDIPEEYSFGLDVSFNPFKENEVFISANYYPMFSTNKGETMVRVKTPYFLSDGSINYFNNGEEEHLYYGVQFGFSHKNMQTSEETGYNIMPLNFVTVNSGTGMLADASIAGRVYTYSGGFMGYNLSVSNDHGATQDQIHSTFGNLLHDVKSLPGQPNKVWASFSALGENVELFEIDFSDLGNIQSNQLSLPSSSGPVMGFLFGEEPGHAIAAKGSRVHKTTNGGGSWTESSTGLHTLDPDFDLIFKMVSNPLNPDQISIASNLGVYTSLDRGNNWSRLNNIFVHNLKHSTVNQGHIIAATHNSNDTEFALICSKDGGESWYVIPEEDFSYLMSSNIFTSTDFDFHGDFVDAYIATVGLGVVKFTIDLSTLKVVDSDFVGNKSTTIYPNPAKDVVNIQTKEKINSVEIYSLTGQKILTNSTDKVNVSHLNKGIYVVKILLENGKTETHKLIKE